MTLALRLAIITVGLILTAVWLVEVLTRNASRKRRERDRARESANLRHIVGEKRWWKDPPGDGPEGDH